MASSLVRKILFVLVVAGLTVCAGFSHDAFAGVTIKVRALNPLETRETAVINYPLPREIKQEHILDQKVTYSMEFIPEEGESPRKKRLYMNFDEDTGVFYIDDEVLLMPKEVVTIQVDVKDVWVIDSDQIDQLRREVKSLADEWQDQNEESPFEDEDPGEGGSGEGDLFIEETRAIVDELKMEILTQLDQILEWQASHTIYKVGVEKHIKTYNENIQVLRQVKQDLSMLANLILMNREGGVSESDEGGGEMDAPDSAEDNFEEALSESLPPEEAAPVKDQDMEF